MKPKLDHKKMVDQNELVINHEFAQAVLDGLTKEKKELSSKYFYDLKGSELFNQITHHPDYYLTNCEIEILEENKNKLSWLLSKEAFNLIELGPGEGIKARILIDEFMKNSLDFNYFAVDISKKYLNQIVKQFNKEQPYLKTHIINSDFFSGLKSLNTQSKARNMVLFLGSSIGNFDTEHAKKFFRSIWENLQNGDYFFVGFDLKKDIEILLKAYNDSDYITKAFNLNLLERLNRELRANFDLSAFNHFGTYNAYLGAMESYLISLKNQTVFIQALNKSFVFEEFEPIHVECSYKYTERQIKEFALTSGFEVVDQFTDSKNYFLNSLWKVRK